MTVHALEREACQFRPGDGLRQGGETFVVRRVAVSDTAVRIEAAPIVDGRPGETRTLDFLPGELVRVGAPPTDPTRGAAKEPALPL